MLQGPKNTKTSVNLIFKILTATLAILIIFLFFEQKIKSNNIFSEMVNPYQKLNDNQYLIEQLGDYGKNIIIKINGEVFVNRHPANSPEFFGQVYRHFPKKQNREIRILFLGNSQLFQVEKNNPYPVPFRTEQLLREKMKNQNIQILNLSCFGMNISEILLTSIKALNELEPDFIVLAITPRDLVNEETKTLGIAPPYAAPILEPSIQKTLLIQHLLLLKRNSLKLMLESFAQFSRVWQREINQSINNWLTGFWPTYNARGALRRQLTDSLLRRSRISPVVPRVEASLVKSPSLENPLYTKEPYPSVRTFQLQILFGLLGQNPDSVLIYNEPLRPKTISFYFTPSDYSEKLRFFGKQLS